MQRLRGIISQAKTTKKRFTVFGYALAARCKSHSYLQAVKIHQLVVAKSRYIFGYACDSAPLSDKFCLALADEALFQRTASQTHFTTPPATAYQEEDFPTTKARWRIVKRSDKINT